MKRHHLLAALCVLASTGASAQGTTGLARDIAGVYAHAESLYIHLHQNPELSGQERQTAARLARELTGLGFEVTSGVGGTGVVAILKNGAGPTVMLRTELDGLPVTEATGLPYASVVRTRNETGEVGVAHACGHDLHMSGAVGAASIMARTRTQWRGTLLVVGQPAEETGAGAKAMIKDGLLTRFPRPDFAIAVHDDGRLPAGVVTYRAGPMMSNADAVTITIFGKGGHGARPEVTVDPIVIASRLVLSLQTIVSRENSPFDPAVITVGAIHGGTKNNIIPDEVQLLLTVRSFTPEVRNRLLAAITRVAKGEAAAGNSPREPRIERYETATALSNDVALTERVSGALRRELGAGRVMEGQQEMVAEDFSEFHIAGVPTLMLRVGAVARSKYEAAIKSGTSLPSLHSALFAPDLGPSLRAVIETEVIALRSLMSGSARVP